MLTLNKTSNRPLSNDEIARYAPAVVAQAPHASVSDRYSFLRTIDVVDALRGAGWLPVFAGQGKARDITRNGVQRHVVRFRHADAQLKVGDAAAELVLLTSHDATSAFQFHAGLFRYVCGNGLVIADGTFSKISIPHRNVTTAEVIEASYEIIRDVPKLGESVEAMRAVQLSADEQTAFANAASLARWGEQAPADPRALLLARRTEDRGADLWTTYNRVQENLVRGGVRVRAADGKRKKVRAIASVTEDTKLNKALWTLAEEMRRLKTAAA